MISAEMSKKEYILAILRAIENDWSLAKDIQRFVLQGKFDDAALDNLAEIMNTTVHQYISAS